MCSLACVFLRCLFSEIHEQSARVLYLTARSERAIGAGRETLIVVGRAAQAVEQTLERIARQEPPELLLLPVSPVEEALPNRGRNVADLTRLHVSDASKKMLASRTTRS